MPSSRCHLHPTGPKCVPFAVLLPSVATCVMVVLTSLPLLLNLRAKMSSSFGVPNNEKEFESMIALISEDVLLQYPDPNHPFSIHPDASDLNLGSVIKQNNHPVAYYSRKLTKTQQWYTTIEKVLLSIVKTLHTFRYYLFGSKINIYTDHKNLTFYVDNTSSRVLHWCLLTSH
jgi:RNase H-like domain found in reverse transcriptase